MCAAYAAICRKKEDYVPLHTSSLHYNWLLEPSQITITQLDKGEQDVLGNGSNSTVAGIGILSHHLAFGSSHMSQLLCTPFVCRHVCYTQPTACRVASQALNVTLPKFMAMMPSLLMQCVSRNSIEGSLWHDFST